MVKRGGVPAAIAAGLLLLASCTQPNQLATNSPEASPSTTPVTTTPSTAPTPAETPTSAPTPSPRPAKLIIKSLPYHLGEVGVTYGTVVVVAAGGVKPYKWSIQAGTLPPGLVLSKGGSTTGKPTTVGNFSFSVRVDDSAGSAAGAPSSVMVFHQLAFGVPPTIYYCNGRARCALNIPYMGGIPNDKPAVKVLKVTSGAIGTMNVTGQCQSAPTSSPPPGASNAASNGTMTLSLVPYSTWCSYGATVEYELVDHNPCGVGFLCTTSNTISVNFKY